MRYLLQVEVADKVGLTEAAEVAKEVVSLWRYAKHQKLEGYLQGRKSMRRARGERPRARGGRPPAGQQPWASEPAREEALHLHLPQVLARRRPAQVGAHEAERRRVR